MPLVVDQSLTSEFSGVDRCPTPKLIFSRPRHHYF